MNYGFHTWRKWYVQSGSWTMFFHMREKWYVQSEATEVWVSFAPKFPPFLAAYWASLRTHSRRKVFIKEPFLVKKVKSICFTVVKKTVESRRNNSGGGKNRTRRKLVLCFLSELLCLPFISFSLYWNRPFYLNSLIFNCTFRTNS